MRIFISILVSFILSAGINYFFPDLEPSKNIVGNLYTILGIMFSIGLSLAITFNLSGVRNKLIKGRIRNNINEVRNVFIIYFLIISIFYILFDTIEQKDLCVYGICIIKYSHLMIIMMLYVVFYYIYNFLQMQNLNIEIEDALD